jgi:hypothetical protein
MPQQQKKQKGAGSKSSKNPGAASRKAKRKRSHARLEEKKARNVERSSHGMWTWERLTKRNRELNELVVQRRRMNSIGTRQKGRDVTSLVVA